MCVSQVFDGLLKPLDPRLIPNPLPARFDVNKRCDYHQGPGHDTDMCFGLHPVIQYLIDNKVIALSTRPSITNNLLPNHNFGRGLRINCLMTKEESKKDPYELIYDLPKCFMMTWEELMGRTFTTGYDIWSEDVLETKNSLTSINGGRGDTSNPNQITYIHKWGRHFKSQSNNQAPTYRGRHFC